MKKIKIKTIALPEFVGKTRQEVYDYVKKEYPNQLPYDGVDFYDNECLKDGNYHFFFGSVFSDFDGGWSVPCVRWDGSEFYRDGYWFDFDWNASYRVVVLETCELPDDSLSLPLESLNSDPLNLSRLDTLEKRVEKLEGLFNSNLLK